MFAKIQKNADKPEICFNNSLLVLFKFDRIEKTGIAKESNS